jgi:hypothetical protein
MGYYNFIVVYALIQNYKYVWAVVLTRLGLLQGNRFLYDHCNSLCVDVIANAWQGLHKEVKSL